MEVNNKKYYLKISIDLLIKKNILEFMTEITKSIIEILNLNFTCNDTEKWGKLQHKINKAKQFWTVFIFLSNQ